MSGIPSIPFQVVTTMLVGGTRRRETRNATTLPQAMAIYEKEQGKPNTRLVELWVCVQSADRHGGEHGN